jgi:hypothetical protein
MRNVHLLLLLILLSIQVACGDGEEWLHKPPKNWSDEIKIPETDIYEVVASKEYVAVERDLKSKSFVEVDEELAKWFTGHYFKRKENQRTYLVRAVNSNGGTGKYMVYRDKNTLIVTHGSLGGVNVVNKSALLINLEFKLERVFTSVHSAH